MRTYIFLFFLLLIPFYTHAQGASQEVVAEAGDGIYSLLRRHGLTSSEHVRDFLEINKENIGENNSLYKGKTYLIPGKTEDKAEPVAAEVKTEESPAEDKPGTRERIVPLFGKKYERLEIKSQKLKGAVYYLSAGHGGYDPGAIGKYGPYLLAEDEYAYDVTVRLARNLMEHSATVYMVVRDENDGIRDEPILKMDKDEVHHPKEKISLSQRQRLRERTEVVNKLYARHKGAYQRMLAVHVDSRSVGQNIDVFFYHHENSPDGQKLAETIHQTFTDKYKRYQPNRNYFGSVSHRSSLYVLKYTHPPTVFIELGNIKNDLDQRRFVIPDNRQALANWITQGILQDYLNK